MMSKELTPLEALERLRPKTTYSPYYTRSEKRYYCDIVEKALKEKENMENTINELFSENGKVITTIDIKKQLKALEIIKKHLNKMGGIKGNPNSDNEYLISLLNVPINEYELLDEVLKWN